MTEVLLRVTVLLFAAALVALVLRRSSAALRHMIWTLTLVGALLIPLCSWSLPGWQWAILPPRLQPTSTAKSISPSPSRVSMIEDSRPSIGIDAEYSPLPVAPANSPVEIPATPPAPVAENPHVTPPANPAWSWSALLSLLWIAGSVLGLLWIGLGVAAAWYVARRARPTTDPGWREISQHLAGSYGIRCPVEVRECPQLTVPMTWGLFRPVVLVPEGTSAWSEPIKRSVVLHELGHVRRRDCLLLLLARLACAAYWFHPLAWLAIRQLRKTSEQAADDLVLASHVAPPDYAEHLVGIAAQMRGLPFFGHVALPLASRTELEGRVLAILDPRRNHRHLTLRACLALAIAATLLVIPCAIVRLGYAEEQKGLAQAAPGKAEQKGLAQAAPGKAAVAAAIGTVESVPAKAGTTSAAPAAQHFELTIRGPDKKAIPLCSVEIRGNALPTKECVQRGSWIKKGNYGAFLKTDASGTLVLNLPKKPKNLVVSVEQPGYGPYWAEWQCEERADVLPARFVADLEVAWTVGGIIVDRQGKPVEGATIRPSIKFKKRPGDTHELGSGKEAKTDAAGKWRFDCVPISMNDVFVEINHPKFKPARLPLTRAEFGIQPGGQPIAKFTLDRGIIVTGRVTDDSHKPIAGALIRTEFINDIREAKSDEKGNYELVGCEPMMARIVVSAKGRATDMKLVRCAADMGPVDFAMQPGGKIRIRVLDEKGNPAAKSRIFFQRWRPDRFQYFEFDNVSQYTDKNGVWQWNEAPLDEIEADICPAGGMQLPNQRMVARDEEYVFRTHPLLVISGSVIDAKTKKPIKSFRAVPGIRSIDPYDRSGKSHIDWERNESYLAKAGEYRTQFDREYMAHLVRIEADGYQVATSRDIKGDEGKVQIDFALVKAQDIAATLLTPDGRPATGAKIAIGMARSQINVTNGGIDDGSTYAARCEADAAGHFHFPWQEGPYQVVIMHTAGFSCVKPGEQGFPDTIRLTAWARVEGTFRVGAKPAANVTINIHNALIDSYGDDVPHIFSDHHAQTGPDGRFVFERVLPGDGRISRNILLTVDDGAAEVTSSTSIGISLPAGKTTQIDLGLSGRRVIGKLAAPLRSQERALWQFAEIDARLDLPEVKAPPVPAADEKDPKRRAEWWALWTAHDVYEKLRGASPSIFATVARDGSFHIDDAAPGSYVLSVRFMQHAAGHLLNYRFTVPPLDGSRSSQPLDLGTLTLER